MNYIRSCWDNVDTELVVRKVSDLYGNLKEELINAWQTEDWQIQVLMVEICLVIIFFFLVIIAWKIHGPTIGKLLNSDSEVLQSNQNSSNTTRQETKKTQ